MKTSGKLSWFFSTLMLLLLLVGNTPATEAKTPAYVTAARSEIWQSITSGGDGSAAIAIMDGGRVVYSEGFGMANRAESLPVSKDTLFNIGSISKVYCATAIMLLVDEGRVDLDKPVVFYLPEFTMADERYKEITVRMLLNHSSGLPGGSYANSFGFQYHENFLQETLSTLAISKLKHRPGEFSVYCNDGFTIAEMIVEKVSGKKYSQFLAERIFSPLSLSTTGLSVGQRQDFQQLPVARYYDALGRMAPLEAVSFLGSGGLSATVEDLCRFADSFSDGGKHLLSTNSLSEIKKLQPSAFWGKLRNDGMSLGLGWDATEIPLYTKQGLSIFGKSGGTGNFNSMLYTVPAHRISVAVMGTGPSGKAQEIALNILEAYLAEKALIANPAEKIAIPVDAQPIPDEIAAYTGYYAGDSGSILRLEADISKNALTAFKKAAPDAAPVLTAVYNNGYFHDRKGNRYYFTTVNGNRFFVSSGKFDIVSLQKIEPIPVPLQMPQIIDNRHWLRRNAKSYEAPMSAPGYIITARRITALPGYIDFAGIKKIESPTYAGMSLLSVRDSGELLLFEQNGNFWAWIAGLVYMPAELAPVAKNGANQIAIGPEGYNEWLRLPGDSVLNFTLPVQGRVIVLTPASEILYDSALDDGDVFAPSGSFIEIAGNTKDVFVVNCRSK